MHFSLYLYDVYFAYFTFEQLRFVQPAATKQFSNLGIN